MKRARVRGLVRDVARVFGRALVAAGVLAFALALPLPTFTPWFFQMVYVPLLILSFIIYIGKLILDTFFYDHYEP